MTDNCENYKERKRKVADQVFETIKIINKEIDALHTLYRDDDRAGRMTHEKEMVYIDLINKKQKQLDMLIVDCI